MTTSTTRLVADEDFRHLLSRHAAYEGAHRTGWTHSAAAAIAQARGVDARNEAVRVFGYNADEAHVLQFHVAQQVMRNRGFQVAA